MIYPMKCKECNTVFDVECTVKEYEDMVKDKFKCPVCKSTKLIRDWTKQEIDIRWGRGFDRWKTIGKDFGDSNDPNRGNDQVGINDRITPKIKQEIKITHDEEEFKNNN